MISHRCVGCPVEATAAKARQSGRPSLGKVFSGSGKLAGTPVAQPRRESDGVWETHYRSKAFLLSKTNRGITRFKTCSHSKPHRH